LPVPKDIVTIGAVRLISLRLLAMELGLDNWKAKRWLQRLGVVLTDVGEEGGPPYFLLSQLEEAVVRDVLNLADGEVRPYLEWIHGLDYGSRRAAILESLRDTVDIAKRGRKRGPNSPSKNTAKRRKPRKH
jgi:hypothetical protein